MTAGAIVTDTSAPDAVPPDRNRHCNATAVPYPPRNGAPGYRSPGNFNTPRARLRLPCVGTSCSGVGTQFSRTCPRTEVD